MLVYHRDPEGIFHDQPEPRRPVDVTALQRITVGGHQPAHQGSRLNLPRSRPEKTGEFDQQPLGISTQNGRILMSAGKIWMTHGTKRVENFSIQDQEKAIRLAGDVQIAGPVTAPLL